MRFLPVTPAGASLAFELLGTSGDRPVRVYLAGLGSAATVAYLPVVADARLAARGRQLLVDLIGSGWSEPDDSFGFTIDEHALTVIALLDALAVGPVELIGHSLGGSVAISIAAQRPDLVARLVVIEPNLDPGVGSTSAEIAGQREEDFARSGYEALIARILRSGERGDTVATEWGHTLQRWSAVALHRSSVSLLASRPQSFRQQFAEFGGSRLYISGARSDEDLDQIRAIGCEVVVVEDAGHDVMADNLEGFVRALL